MQSVIINLIWILGSFFLFREGSGNEVFSVILVAIMVIGYKYFRGGESK